ncbi:putative reverse transcriptase zinc-binding domain-containing protein [Helianthus annuus]|nr:putative reverse transcriptase zinc-binding domain-containing protein [Helianthus annuus]
MRFDPRECGQCGVRIICCTLLETVRFSYKKVAIVAWRAEMERLPTKCALIHRNITVQNNLCALYGDYAETCEHIFVSCQLSQSVWQNIADWLKIPPIFAFAITDLLDLHGVSANARKKKKALHAVILVTFWCLWKMRNEAVFKQASPNTTKIMDEIKTMAYLWVKNRSKMVELTWEKWCRFEIIG